MDIRQIIASVLEIANELDSEGHFTLADKLTSAARTAGWPEENEHEYRSEQWLLGEDKFEQEQAAMHEVNNSMTHDEIRDRLHVLQNKPNPTGEDVDELEKILEYLNHPDFDPNNVQWPNTQSNSDLGKLLNDNPTPAAVAPSGFDPFADE